MSEVPRSPERFFGEYVPAQLGRLGASLGGFSSVGAVVFDLGDTGAWSLRLAAGVASVVRGSDAEPLVRVTLAQPDFEAIIVAGAEKLAADEAAPERQLMAARVLTVDADRARLLRDAPGSVELVLKAASGAVHRLRVTLGGAAPTPKAECEIECALEDLWAIQSGTKNPFELLMEGKLRMSGKVELAMALGAALG